jgi:hypothetical protein
MIRVLQVLKYHPILKKQTIFVLDREVSTGKKSVKYILFGEVNRGRFNPSRGIKIRSAKSLAYVKGAISLDPKKKRKALQYFFHYLQDPDWEVALDAFREFSGASFPDLRSMAKKLPADKIAGWLKDPKTPAYRYGLYALLLGHCGKAKHAKLVHKILDNPEKPLTGNGLDGMLVAYTMLDMAAGWKYLQGILKNPAEDFQRRYSALRAIRFFWDYRPDVLKKKERVKGICLLLKQTDVADFAIEDLRKWKMWETADQVLELAKRKSYQVPVIQRAILRYALSCPKKKEAAEYVKAERKRDKEYVDDVEELLKLEAEAPGK